MKVKSLGRSILLFVLLFPLIINAHQDVCKKLLWRMKEEKKDVDEYCSDDDKGNACVCNEAAIALEESWQQYNTLCSHKYPPGRREHYPVQTTAKVVLSSPSQYYQKLVKVTWCLYPDIPWPEVATTSYSYEKVSFNGKIKYFRIEHHTKCREDFQNSPKGIEEMRTEYIHEIKRAEYQKHKPGHRRHLYQTFTKVVPSSLSKYPQKWVSVTWCHYPYIPQTSISYSYVKVLAQDGSGTIKYFEIENHTKCKRNRSNSPKGTEAMRKAYLHEIKQAEFNKDKQADLLTCASGPYTYYEWLGEKYAQPWEKVTRCIGDDNSDCKPGIDTDANPSRPYLSYLELPPASIPVTRHTNCTKL